MCHSDDIDEIMRLQEKLLEELQPDDPSFYPTARQDNLAILNEHAAIGCFENSTLVAYLTLLCPDRSADCLGKDLSMPASELPYCATLDTVAVERAFRGNGLQRMLIRQAESIARRKGMRHILATVSPVNTRSLQNFLASGFSIYILKKKYNNLDRFILCKHLVEAD